MRNKRAESQDCYRQNRHTTARYFVWQVGLLMVFYAAYTAEIKVTL